MLLFQKFFDIDELKRPGALGTSDNPSFEVFTLANCITISRIVLTFAFLYFFVSDTHRTLGVCLYALAASTDWLDGQIARRTQTVSWVGKILDPICDRVLLFVGVGALVYVQTVPLWIAVFLILRDMYLALGTKLLRKYTSRPLDVAYIGKVATAFLMLGFVGCLVGLPTLHGLNITTFAWLPVLNTMNGPVGLIFIYIGTVLSFLTAVVYTLRAYKLITKAQSKLEV